MMRVTVLWPPSNVFMKDLLHLLTFDLFDSIRLSVSMWTKVCPDQDTPGVWLGLWECLIKLIMKELMS